MATTKKTITEDLAISTCRVSTKKQKDNNHSLSRQAEAVLEAAKKLGVKIPEDGQWSCAVSSKKGKNLYRKDLAEMIAYCKRHKNVKYVIVDEPDRFMRSISEAFYFEVEFNKIGVIVYYACDDILNGDDPMAKLMRFMRYFSAETSNDERERKALGGIKKAVKDGRSPSPPKLGYEKGKIPGIHNITKVGIMLKSLLIRITAGEITVKESLTEFNRSEYVKSGQHSAYDMDKWKQILTTPYYARIIRVRTKDGVLCNENGKHKPLITKEQHETIKSIVYNKPKAHIGPRKGGNPHYPLNTILFCKKCWDQEKANGKDERHNQGKFVGYTHHNNKGNIYERYGCRKCRRSIIRDEVHNAVKRCFDSIGLSDDKRERFKKFLNDVWSIEEDISEDEIVRLNNELPDLQSIKKNLMSALGRTTNQEIASELENDIAEKIEQIKTIETKIENLKKAKSNGRTNFLNFALKYVDDLASNFFKLPLEKVKMCEQLVFPSGFIIDEKNRVRTPKISSLYRYKTSFLMGACSQNPLMVTREDDTSHKKYQSKLTINKNQIKEINAEIDRWYELLDIKFIASQKKETE